MKFFSGIVLGICIGALIFSYIDDADHESIGQAENKLAQKLNTCEQQLYEQQRQKEEKETQTP